MKNFIVLQMLEKMEMWALYKDSSQNNSRILQQADSGDQTRITAMSSTVIIKSTCQHSCNIARSS